MVSRRRFKGSDKFDRGFLFDIVGLINPDNGIVDRLTVISSKGEFIFLVSNSFTDSSFEINIQE